MDKPAKDLPVNSATLDVPADLGNPQMRWGSDVVAEVIRGLDLDYIALVPGASYRGFHDSLVNYLGNRNPQMVVCLHETHAVAIADGYARVTDRPMAAALHSNVGLMNASMAIFSAWCDRLPMVIFGATGPVDAHKRRPWIDWIHTGKDQASMIRHFVKWDDQPASPEAAVESVLRAYQIAATAPHGPVYVCLDAAMQEEALAEEVRIPPASRYRPPPPPAVPEETIGSVAAAIKRAKFPVLLVGKVSRGEDDWDRRVRLADAIGGAVVTCIRDAAGFPTDHPLHVTAPSGERPGPAQRELMSRADLIIALNWVDLSGFLRGCLDASQTQDPTPATVVSCTLDSSLHNGWGMELQALAAVDIAVQARPEEFVRQLLDALGPEPASARPALADIVHWTQLPPDTKAQNGQMDLRDVAGVVEAFCNDHTVTLARLPIGWPGDTCRFRGPLDYIGKEGGGAVGTGPGHTVGIALALKDSGRIVVGVMGDGDYMMGVNALWSASHMRLPMMIVVTNNQSYFNDEAHQERVAVARERPPENKWIGQRLDDPPADLVGFAKAQGFEGEVAESPDALADALRRGADIVGAGGRYLIDARIVGKYMDSGRTLGTRN